MGELSLSAPPSQSFHHRNHLLPAHRSTVTVSSEERIAGYLDRPALALATFGAEIGYDFDQGGP